MAFGGSEGFASPPQTTPELEHWFAQVLSEIRELFTGSFPTLTATTTLRIPVFTNATRPPAGNAGRLIFNTDDGLLNVDNGTNWTLPDGTIT